MGVRTGRIACPRCGSNNFDTVTLCWKCNAPLSGAPPAPVAAAPVPTSPAIGLPSSPHPGAAERFLYSATGSAAAAAGNPRTANAAAIWLGLLFPFFGLPIGLAFLMCDDQRRQEVGRLCLIWSVISSVIHLLLMFVSLIGLREYILFAFNTMKAQAGRVGGMGGAGSGMGNGLE